MMLMICGLTWAQRLAASGRIKPVVVGLLLCLQALLLLQDPRPYYINVEDRQRYAYIMSALATPGQSTCYINRSYLSLLAGKPTYAQVGEECWGNKAMDLSLFSQERRDYINSDPWDIIIDEPLEHGSFVLYQRLNETYRPMAVLPRVEKYADYYDIRWRKVMFERR